MEKEDRLDALRNRNPITTITADEFVRFLSFKASDTKCESCGSSSFRTINDLADETNAAIFQAPVGMHTEERIGFISTLAIMCENCGLIRHHAYRKVQHWLNENPIESSTHGSDADGR